MDIRVKVYTKLARLSLGCPLYNKRLNLFKRHLESISSITPKKLECVLECCQDKVEENMTIRHYLIRCTSDKIREDDFIIVILS